MKNVEINCGIEKMSIQLPFENFSWELGPKKMEIKENSVRNALRNPINQKEISQLARGKENIVIVIDDNTRNTPTNLILPEIIEELNVAGVSADQVKILVALGTHRRMTQEELIEKCGALIIENYQIIQHDYLDEDNLVDFGITKLGTPIKINRHYMDANLRIAIGKIIPHVDAVWSGGAKIILPGICGKETIEKFHLCSTQNRENLNGEVCNIVREEMEDVARQVGLDFLVNVVIDDQKNIIATVAGDFVDAHRQGVEVAQRLFCVKTNEIEKADMIIVSAFPADEDFWQAGKAVTAVAPLVKENGSIVLVSACYKGYCPDHPICLALQDKCIDEIENMIENESIEDKIGATVAIDVKKIQQTKTIFYCGGGIDQVTLNKAMLIEIDDLADFLSSFVKRLPECKIGVVHNGTEFMVLNQ